MQKLQQFLTHKLSQKNSCKHFSMIFANMSDFIHRIAHFEVLNKMSLIMYLTFRLNQCWWSYSEFNYTLIVNYSIIYNFMYIWSMKTMNIIPLESTYWKLQNDLLTNCTEQIFIKIQRIQFWVILFNLE